jgi:hypothetical protein
MAWLLISLTALISGSGFVGATKTQGPMRARDLDSSAQFLVAAGELPHRVRKTRPAQDSDSTLTHREVAELKCETEGERTRFDRYTNAERLSLLGSQPQPG